jgi:hypothetical protein
MASEALPNDHSNEAKDMEQKIEKKTTTLMIA